MPTLGPYTVYLRNPGGEWVSKSAAFTVTAPTPTVTGISPGSRCMPGETLRHCLWSPVTGFTRGAQVALESTSTHPAWFDATDEVCVNPTAIRCTLAIPPGALARTYAASGS